MNCTCTCLRLVTRPLLKPTSFRTFSTTLPSFSTPSPSSSSTTPPPTSSCVAGTKITGLNYLKDGTDPIALEDSEYPSWLWTILETRKGEQGTEEGKLFDEKVRMKGEGKKGIRAANALKG